jgi:type I restriction enzyme M protein
MQTHSEIVSFIWGTANLIRDSFKRGKYQDVILPFTVLRRIDSVLQPTKDEVLEAYHKYKGELDNLDPILRRKSGYAFYNTSNYTFKRLLSEDPSQLSSNLRTYIAGFSENMREVIEKFDFRNTISKLEQAGLLYQVMDRFKNVDLHPDTVSNEQMGLIFEELIRKFNEALDENPGEHFTPREVVRLMTELVLAGDRAELGRAGRVFKIYDPCCGTGGMLTAARDRVREISEDTEVYLFGQEVNPETYAICKSDLYLKTEDGRDADRIAFGSTLSNDQHRGERFDYQLANPPYGKDWKRDKKAVKQEAERGDAGRFEAGTPRISDGQLLFLQHMVSHMKPETDDGGRVAIIMNGSPLFTGSAGSGESEIRRWLMENDWVEAIIQLPEQIFYNTGISTYVWVLSNTKDERRKGKVQLIDGSDLWCPMRKSLGSKRRYIGEGEDGDPNQVAEIVGLYEAFDRARQNGDLDDRVQIFDTEDFGYRKIRVERPLRVNLRPSADRIERVWDQRYFGRLDDEVQEQVVAMLHEMEDRTYYNYADFRSHLKEQLKAHGISIRKKKRTDILDALSEKDPDADPVRDTKGRIESDTDLRDYENVPLTEDVFEYFEREVKPHVEDAFIDEDYTDEQDGKVGRVGYEINFNRYFYEYEPPRPLEEIEKDIRDVENDIIEMLREVAA